MEKGKIKLTQKDAENTPAGGVVVGKRKGQTMIYDDASVGGYFVGKTHAKGGIKMINKSNGQPLEVQGSEVIITAPAVADQTKHNFNGKMMTNREILSEINVKGGGVAFAEKGMEIPKSIKRTGASYNYGGKTMTDHEIYKYITGGGIAEDFSIRDIANIHQVPLSELKEEVRIGMLAESEHKADKKEQMEIVKDHLLENPKYYTLLKKAGLVEEKTALLEKSKWLKQFYVTNNPSIDKLLKDLQPKIQELIEKQKELVIKETTKTFGEPRPMTELDVDFYEAGLIFKMVQAFNKYLKNTDELYDVSINKRRGLFEVNAKVKRGGRSYNFDTELIDAGGYNIQEYHYRYIIKTDLPSSNENSAVENIKSKIGVLKKIRTIDEDILRYTNRISLYEKELKQGFTEFKYQNVQHKKDLTDNDIKFRQRDIKNFQKEIEKLEGKKSDLLSVFSSLEKKGVGVNFGKQVKEAIGRKLLDRLRASKYKETGDTLDFKIESLSIRKDISENKTEILGTINTFSFTDEGNGLCTMKAGLELRGKYTQYAEFKHLPINEIPYKINEVFNGEFSKYLQYDDGGELYSSENDYVKYLLDRNLETDLAEIKLKNYLQSKNIQSGMPLPDSIRKDEEYQKLKRDFDLAFSKMQKKPIHKNSRNLDRVQRQKDLRRYKEILDDIIKQKFKKGAFDDGGAVDDFSDLYQPDFFQMPKNVTLNDIIKKYDEEAGLSGMIIKFKVGDRNLIVQRKFTYRGGGGKMFQIKTKYIHIDWVDDFNKKYPKYYKTWKETNKGIIETTYPKFKKGGQVENLVKDAKTGNTPARDLNNYNDMLDVEADGEVGGDTGLFAGGGMMANGGLIAPNGKPSNLTPEQYKLVRTPEFKAWFGDWENDPENASKVVDENGEPLVVYHGTNSDFNVFDTSKINASGEQVFKFTTNYDMANAYGEKVFSVFLSIKNNNIGSKFYPKMGLSKFYANTTFTNARLDLIYESVKAEESQGGVIYGLTSNDLKYKGDVYFVHFSNQIKLADGSNTTFDANNPDIRFDGGGAVGRETVLFAVRKGEPDYNEVLITNNPDRIEDAKKWALANGFDRLRVSTIDMREKPDFRKTFEGGGYMENGGYLDALSEKSKKTIDSNYNREFGIYDFDFNKESKRENYFEWFTKFKNEQFKKNLKKGINAVSEDIDLLEKRKQSDKKLKDFEELILPTLGNDVKNPSLSEYQEMVFMNPYATEEELRKALSDTSIFNEDGSINKAKITESEFFNEEGINLPSFERFAEKNPEYKGVFDSWKKMLDENMALHNKETNAFRYPSIADLKELKEELSNLHKTNYATGGSIKPYDANMEGDSADMIFDDGGSVQKSKDANVFSSKVFEWDKVPSNYKNIKKVKKITYINNPLDKGLDEIIRPFLGDDDLRPSMTGVNFDDNGITATNAHILITLPYPNKKYDGIYDINKVKKEKSNELVLINENYPKYENIIPKWEEAGKPFLVDVYKLLQYTKTALNYANKTTYAIAYKFGDNEVIGFNGKFLITTLTAILKLGHEKIYVFITRSNRAIILSPNPEYELGNDELLLTMPVMLNKTQYYDTSIDFYGTQDIDYGSEFRVYFDFNDSEIHNADGSVAEFKMEYESNTAVDDSYLSLLSKITKKRKSIAILDYVKVYDGKMVATDLDIELVVKNVNMPNGIYQIINNAPTITMEAIEDFPRQRVYDKDEYHTRGNVFNKNNETPNEKIYTAFDFTINSDVFEFYLDKLLLSVGDDDLRPVMSGICIHKTSDNNLFLVSTNAHTLCVINITEYCDFIKDDRELKYILPVYLLKDFVKLTDGTLHIKCNMSNIFIESENLDYVAEAIDGNYPNYQAVIPKEQTNKIVFDHVAMNNCIKSQKFKDLIAKHKGDKNIQFTITNSGDKLYLRAFKLKGYRIDSQSELVDEIELCDINFNHSKEEKTISNTDSLFLLMPVSNDVPKNNQYFNFGKDLFEVMLQTITDTEVECYYSEFNKGYVFPIDAIDFKKTTKPEKTKQQKLSKKDVEEIIEMQDLEEELAPIVENVPEDKKTTEKKYVIESKGFTQGVGSSANRVKRKKEVEDLKNKIEIEEAIETLEILLETASRKDKKEIKEAIEVLQMLLDTSI